MPFKHNAARRDRIPGARFRITNWPVYEAGLRHRGDLTFWVDEAVLAGWHAPRRSTPGGQTPRDRHIQLMGERGRIGWQRATGYGRRNHAETAMGRYKHLIGPKLRAHTRPGQRGEVVLAIQVLNRMIRTAKPVSVPR